MYCTKCGNEISNGQRFCSNCGAESKGGSDLFSGTTLNTSNTFDVSAIPNTMPMKWYKFLIYFALIAGAILNFGNGILMLTGGIYSVQTGGQATADLVYSMYGMSLKTVDMFYGIVLLAAAVLAIMARNKLVNYKNDGPKFLYLVYGISMGIVLIYNILVGMITGMGAINATTITQLVTQGVLIYANIVYFNKRLHLFVN